jgi:hypothetical protein
MDTVDEENLKRVLGTPKDISNLPTEEQSEILTLHFIGYLAKPTGINEEVYLRCLIAFNANRGKVEEETKAIEEVLIKEDKNG